MCEEVSLVECMWVFAYDSFPDGDYEKSLL